MPPRKGGSRKAFLKTARAGPEEEETPADSQPAPVQPAQAAADAKPAADLAARFLKDEPAQAPVTEAADGGEAPEPSAGAAESAEAGEPAGDGAETRGQLMQRHKRELKAHKEHAKKLGKKRKEEAEELGAVMEARHATELAAWDASHADGGDGDATLVAPTAGLYDLKIGASAEDSQPKLQKQSKAQKRREQKAAAEAQREARIAREQAAAGPSEREREAAALAELLAPLGLRIQEVPADGHCMYRSVADQLAAAGQAEPPSAAELRGEAASYMRAFPDAFRPFVVEEDVQAGDASEAAFESYCTEIEETAAWGGQIELQALAHALERHITVHAVGLPAVELGCEYKGKQPSLQLCYLRHAFGLGEHYNSLRPAESAAA